MSVPFFANRMAFFMFLNVLFHFFEVPFDLVCLPKAPFYKGKGHWGTRKEEKWKFFFL